QVPALGRVRAGPAEDRHGQDPALQAAFVTAGRRFTLTAAGKRLEAQWLGPPPDEAPTLVFLHEGLGSLGLWRDFPAAAVARTGLGALVYSRAGYGGSDPCE